MRSYGDAFSIPPETWSRATDARNFFATLPWVRSVEGTFGRDRRYVVSSDQTGAAALYETTPETYHFYNATSLLLDDPALTNGHIEGAPACERLRSEMELIRELVGAAGAVLCSPYGFGHPLSAYSSDRAVVEVLDALEEQQRAWNAPTAALTYDRGGHPLLVQELTRRGFIPIDGGSNCVLPVPADGIPAYLRGLSKGGRRSARHELTSFEDHGLTTEETTLTPALIPQLAALQAALEAKYGNAGDYEHEVKALSSIASHLGSCARIRLTHKAGRLVGFELFYEHQDRWYAKMGGYDEGQLARDDYAYFVAAYYRMVEMAAARGINAIEYGPYAYEVKAQRGCRPEPMTTWIRVPNTLRPAVVTLAGHQRRLSAERLPARLRDHRGVQPTQRRPLTLR